MYDPVIVERLPLPELPPTVGTDEPHAALPSILLTPLANRLVQRRTIANPRVSVARQAMGR